MLIPPIAGARLTLAMLWRALPWALFVATALYALVAINGFGIRLPVIGFVGVEGYAPANERLKADLAGVVSAQGDAELVHRTAKETAEQILAQVAEGVDENARIMDAAADAATTRFANANRMRCPATGSAPGQAVAAAADRGTGDTETAGGVPELAGVLVSERDIRIAAQHNVIALACRKFVTDLERITAEANQPPS